MRHKKYDPQAAETTLDTLLDVVKPHLALNKARLRCFAMLVLAVIGQRTVSLAWLSQHPATKARSESVLRRFERFFAGAVLRPKQVGASFSRWPPSRRKAGSLPWTAPTGSSAGPTSTSSSPP